MLAAFFTKIKQSSYLAFALILYGLALSLIIPRQVGLSFRYEFSTVIPIVFLLLSISFQVSGWVGRLVALAVTLLLFALPLSGLWNSGQSERYIIGGLLPFSDAYHYYMDAKSLLIQHPFSDFTARRPLFSAFLSVILYLSNQNLQITQAILVFITAFACYLAVREFQRTLGTLPAVLFLIIIFLFYRPLSGKTLTENLGLPLGLLGFALLWRCAREEKALYAYIGLFVITIGLNARAGTFFFLPAVIIWGAFYFRKYKKISLSFTFFSILSVLLGFALNILIFKTFTGGGMPFSNFSYTIFGLASGGKSWTYIYTAYPLLNKLPEPQFSYKVYELALAEIGKNPLNLLNGMASSWKMFFGTGEYSVFCYVGGENKTLSLLLKLGLYGLGLIGIIFSTIKLKKLEFSLIIFSFVGILISIPFVPPIDASNMRAYAATIPIIAIIPSLGFFFILEKINWRWLHQFPREVFSVKLAPNLAILIILVTIMGPILIKPFQKVPVFNEISCPPGETALYLRMFKGSYLELVGNETISGDWLPKIRINYFLNNVHNLPNFEAFYDLDRLTENTTLLYDLDLKSGLPYMAFINSAQIPLKSQLLGVCGKLTDNPTKVFRFFYANSVTPLSYTQ